MQRLAQGFAAAMAIGIAWLIPGRAIADGQVLPLVASGDWAAVEHLPSFNSTPDMCVARTATSGQVFGLRATETDIEVRFSDQSWSLPADVSGSLVLDVGTIKLSLDISDNTNSMVIAEITVTQLQYVISAMDNAGSMTITPGKAAPITVSLNGSNTATTAFLTCAGITAPREGEDRIRSNEFKAAGTDSGAARWP
ncbi:MAG: hypothetical protein ACREFO_03910 [Acetobacteraceae bacterium]